MNAHVNPANLTQSAPLSLHEQARLGDAWRHTLNKVAECELMIAQHRKVIAERDVMLLPKVPLHRPAYVAQCERQLVERMAELTELRGRLSEFEARMRAAGMRAAS